MRPFSLPAAFFACSQLPKLNPVNLISSFSLVGYPEPGSRQKTGTL